MSEVGSPILILGAIFITALIAESLWPLRKATCSKIPRIGQNLAVAAVSGVVIRLAFLPIELLAADYVTKIDFGLLNWLTLSGWTRLLVALVLLDYTLYFWHRMNHRFPLLWRFHNVHHTDLDLDASTATRFHVGELAFSTIYRVGQIVVFGIDIQTLLIFETCVTAFAIFHHSNLRLPLRLERLVVRFIVTPRMHGIHHSIVRGETDSNYSTILSAWDRIHRSKVLGVKQWKITIGVPAYRDQQSLASVLIMPFQKPRRWLLPDNTTPLRQQYDETELPG